MFTAAVLAYQMTCEVLPFRARSLPELIGQMLQRRPAAPATLNPDVSASRVRRRCSGRFRRIPARASPTSTSSPPRLGVEID